MSQPEQAPESGDGRRQSVSELERLLESAGDALTDDVVTRLSGTIGGGLDLLDRVNRSGLEQALPVITQMVESGDLQRLANLARLLGSAEDALSDDIVGRVAASLGDGLDLLDRVNRSGVSRALPAITSLVDSGDLDRVVSVARLLGSASDALSEDIISRLAETAAQAMVLMDRVARNDSLLHLLSMLERPESRRLMEGMGDALAATCQELEGTAPAKGGVGGLLHVAKQPGTQEGLKVLGVFTKHLSQCWVGRRPD